MFSLHNSVNIAIGLSVYVINTCAVGYVVAYLMAESVAGSDGIPFIVPSPVHSTAGIPKVNVDRNHVEFLRGPAALQLVRNIKYSQCIGEDSSEESKGLEFYDLH